MDVGRAGTPFPTCTETTRQPLRVDVAPPRLFSRLERFEFTCKEARLRVSSYVPRPLGHKVVEVVSSGHQTVIHEFSRDTVIFPLAGTLHFATADSEGQASAGDLAIFAPIRRRTTVYPGANGVYRSLSIISPARRGRREQEDEAGRNLSYGEWVLRRNLVAANSVVSFLEYLLSDLRSEAPVLNTDRAHSAVETLVQECFQEVTRGPDRMTHGTSNCSWLAGRAREFIVENHQGPISIGDVAVACGTSMRMLQITFRREFGTSPREMLNAVRLGRVRSALERPTDGMTVAQAALDAGFCHLGRFSRLYATMFGEKPSETLARASTTPLFCRTNDGPSRTGQPASRGG